MKLANFRALDPEHTAQGKQGLTRGGQGDRDVWAEYSGGLADLHAAAAAIKAASDAKEDIDLAQDDAFVDAAEGRLLSRMHVARERSRDLVVRKKAADLKSRGKLVCVFRHLLRAAGKWLYRMSSRAAAAYITAGGKNTSQRPRFSMFELS